MEKRLGTIFALVFLLLGLTLVIAQTNNETNQTNADDDTSDDTNETDNDTNETEANDDYDADDGNETDADDDDDNQGTTVTKSRTRLKDLNITRKQVREIKRNITFTPWQKRNESECPAGCNCRGAVVSCPTENGRVMTITAGRSGNVIILTFERTNVSTELEIEQEVDENNISVLRARLRNGKLIKLKRMPDVARQKALKRLKLKTCSEENSCSFKLKQEGEGDDAILAYEVKAKRNARFLGLFKMKMNVESQVDAETGEIIKVKKPWWAFLAAEPEE